MIPFVTKWVEFPPPSLIGVLRSSILGTSPVPGLATEWVQVVGHLDFWTINRSGGGDFWKQGSLKFPVLGESKECKSMAILRDFPYNNVLFGLEII